MTRAGALPVVALVGLGGLAGACGGPAGERALDAPAAIDAGPIASYPSALALTATCGDLDPTPTVLTIANSGPVVLYIDAFTVTGDFVVEGLDADHPLVIQPDGYGTLKIYPPPTRAADVPGAVTTGALGLSANVAGGIPDVALSATVMGAALALDGPIALTADAACPTQTALLRNTGNLATAVGPVRSASGYVASAFAGTTLAPGAAVPLDLRLVTASACAGSDAIAIAATHACAPFTADATFAIAHATACSCD